MSMSRRHVITLLVACALAAPAALGCRSERSEAPKAVPAGSGGSDATSEPPKKAAVAPPANRPPAPAEKGAAKAEPASGPIEQAFAQPSEQWYGVYMMGKKVGHARVWSRRLEGEGAGYATGTEVSMTVKGLGGATTIRIEERREYAEKAPHPLTRTRFLQEASGVRDERVAVATDGGLEVERTVGDQAPVKKTLSPVKETLASLMATMGRGAEPLKKGQVLHATMFNWQTEKEEAVTIAVEDVEEDTTAGVKTRTMTLGITYEEMGIKAITKVTGEGAVLEMSLGAGLKMKLEEKAFATSDIAGLDVLGSGIAVDRKLGDPATVAKLALTVTSPEDYELPATKNQVVVRKSPTELAVVLTAGPGDAVTEADRAKALKSDAIMDSDSEAIKAKAREIVGDAKTDADKVTRLLRWVYATLDKQLATHLPTASQVLDKKVGDCTEHTWLFTALARAVGIPARPIYGVAYVGDRQQSFGYHAWVEVDLDGHWLPVDPTWNQRVADATHLRLSSELHELAPAMGGLTIKVASEPERR